MKDKNGKKITIIYSILIVILILAIICIWGLLFLGVEKGAEDSWGIGVGLFGSIVGGIFTLIAVLIPINENREIQEKTEKMHKEQLLITILNDYIAELNKIKKVVDEVRESIGCTINIAPMKNDKRYPLEFDIIQTKGKIEELREQSLAVRSDKLSNDINNRILFIQKHLEGYLKDSEDSAIAINVILEEAYNNCNYITDKIIEEIKVSYRNKYSLIK